MEILPALLIMFMALILEGFFSGSEMGVVSADRLKLRQDAAKGSRGAKLALRMLEKPEWLLSTTLVGTNISVVTNTTVATALMIDLFGPDYRWLAIVLVAPLIWIFGEVVPKSIFQQKANEITPQVIFVLRFFSLVFYPILLVFSLLTRLLTKLVGERKSNIFTLREQIISMSHLSEPGGEVDPMQGQMIRRMFRFSETPALQVVVPLIDVIGVDKSATCGDAVHIAAKSAHRNLVVFDGRIDLIVGMVHSLELLGVEPDCALESFIRPVRYVGGTKNVQSLLRELRKTDEGLAVVVDEYGTARGIVTAEDIMEEVVFDMQDEFDRDKGFTPKVQELGEQDYLVSGRIELGQLEDRLGILIRKGPYQTLAGYLLEKSHEVPPGGTVIESHGIKYQITKRTNTVIEEVRITW
ncbi:MAG: HlyC/CorC family transporter [Gammaproteobacteria bacterium]|nr:HlyC/CorC family transporter [Gammaproteobacteria bacterium]